MSARLPLLVNNQSKLPFQQLSQLPQKKSKEQQADHMEMQKAEQPVEDYEAEQYEAEPLQTVVSLKPTVIAKELNEKNQDSRVSLEKLRQLYEQKNREIVDLRNVIQEKKKEIKDIGEQVDKDLNKSLLKVNKTAQFNIRDIFSAPLRMANPKINQCNQEIRKVRFQAKKIKGEIQKLADIQGDALRFLNQERGSDYEVRLRDYETEIRTIQKEKQLLNEQLSRAGKQINDQQDHNRNADFSALKNTLGDIIAQLKQEKSELYRMERQDILLMEKVKFIQEKQGLLGIRKARGTEREKGVIDEQIRILVKQINQVLEERNKSQNQKRISFRNLTNDVSGMEVKNWDLCNKLREMDAFILQYYEKKTKKKDSSKVETIKPQKCQSTKGETIEVHIQTSKIEKNETGKQFSINDKNMSESQNTEVALIQKRKTYEFSLADKINSRDITFSDEFLGNKNVLRNIYVTADKQYLYGLRASYFNYCGQQLEGLLLGFRDPPLDYQEFRLEMQLGEVVNLVNVGLNSSGLLGSLQIVTSQGKQLKWMGQQPPAKFQQKTIRKYEYASLKVKLSPVLLANQTEVLALSGLTLSTVYSGVK